MRLYHIQFDGQPYYVEAPAMGEAIVVWREAMREPWGDDWTGDEEPESCALVDDKPVIRAGAPR